MKVSDDMKVLIVNKFLYPNGGSETYIFNIGLQLQQMGNEVQYFGMEHTGRIVGNHAESYTSAMDFHTGKIQRIFYPFKIIYSWESRKKIRKVLDDFQPDVVQLNNINFQITPSVIDEIVMYKKKNGKKIHIVYTAHDYQWVCPNHMMMIPETDTLCTRCVDGKNTECFKNRCIHNSRIKSFIGAVEAELYKRLGTYGKIDAVICPSEYMGSILRRNKDINQKIIVLRNFLNYAEIPLNIQLPSNIPERYVLYFGRYDHLKGVTTLLQVCKQLPEITFVFAGKGEMEHEIDAVDNVTNVGFQGGAILQNLISNALFSVFPSEYYENCPFSVMESQMYGTPLIASDRGGTPELVKEHITGEIFHSGSVDELREKVKYLWNNPNLISQYRDNCRLLRKNGDFDSLEDYCKKLLSIYYA